MKNDKYVIEKNPILKKWVVWERDGSALFMVFKGKRKKDCKKWIEENEGKENNLWKIKK